MGLNPLHNKTMTMKKQTKASVEARAGAIASGPLDSNADLLQLLVVIHE